MPQPVSMGVGYQDKMIQIAKKFINDCKSAYQTGRAFKMIERGSYATGAALLEKLCRNENKNAPEYLFFRLGDCYYRMQKYSRAVKWLKKSFDIYESRITVNKDIKYLSFYTDVKETYINVLELNGQHERATNLRMKNVGHS